jgi:penicillin-binding protein 2
MHAAASQPGGTSQAAMAGAAYTVAGKTGTAQVVGIARDEKYDAEALDENNRDNALYIAYAPAENPEIALAIVVENVAKGGGGSNAAPVARKLLDVYFGPESDVEYVAQLITF